MAKVNNYEVDKLTDKISLKNGNYEKITSKKKSINSKLLNYIFHSDKYM